MSKTTEPAPLTEREMNQFVTLAALPTLERALERLRWLEAQRAVLTNPTTIMVRLDGVWITPSAALDEITRLRAELAAVKAERDEALLRWQRLYGEIDCRVEHGADSNGHLEAIRKRMQKEAKR